MRLIDNKEDISYEKVWGDIYWKEDNIWYSDNNISYKQYMDIRIVTTSNYLIHNISNEINRE
jgi:hypothetical protein